MNREEINNKYLQEKYFINLRLERLRQNKEQEIEEYIKKWVSGRPDFGAMIRKDLERSYAKKEKELEEKIKEIDLKINKNNVEKQEFNLNKTLGLEKEELKEELRELTLNHQKIISKLSDFEYIYDNQNNIINGEEYKKLFDQANKLINEKYDLTNLLNQIEEYLANSQQESLISSIESDTSSISLEKIYEDIMEAAKELITIKVEKNQVYSSDKQSEYSLDSSVKIADKQRVKFPNGVYINIKDINDALKNYEKKEKGKTHKINSVNSNNKIVNSLLNQIKQFLIECSIVKLLSEKKLGFFDIKRVYGNEVAQQLEEQAKSGGIKTSITQGNYINLEEFSDALKEIINIKGQSWIHQTTEKANNKILM